MEFMGTNSDGLSVGNPVLGYGVGNPVGFTVGITVGSAVGNPVGCDSGNGVGGPDGNAVGINVGDNVSWCLVVEIRMSHIVILAAAVISGPSTEL